LVSASVKTPQFIAASLEKRKIENSRNFIS
jgi:hypothetical protein